MTNAYKIMALLGSKGHPLTVQELTDGTEVLKASVRTTLFNKEKKGFVKREPDGRYSITPAGRRSIGLKVQPAKAEITSTVSPAEAGESQSAVLWLVEQLRTRDAEIARLGKELEEAKALSELYSEEVEKLKKSPVQGSLSPQEREALRQYGYRG